MNNNVFRMHLMALRFQGSSPVLKCALLLHAGLLCFGVDSMRIKILGEPHR